MLWCCMTSMYSNPSVKRDWLAASPLLQTLGVIVGLFGFDKKTEPVDRYAGQPFLKLVDSFVLKSIGELDPSQEALLEQMTPKFQEAFSCAGSWEEIVVSQLQFPSDFRSSIQTMWRKNQEIAKQNGVTLVPMQFVEMFVASNVTNS